MNTEKPDLTDIQMRLFQLSCTESIIAQYIRDCRGDMPEGRVADVLESMILLSELTDECAAAVTNFVMAS